jgi:SAM-dependent methyltransferase
MTMEEAQPADASSFGMLYQRIYASICGKHPNFRLWHFQYLILRDTHRWQRERMAVLRGVVLDAGCGNRPYEQWLTHGPNHVTRYIGLDIATNPSVDIVVDPEQSWPIPDASVDGVLSTQVLEHVARLPITLAEMARVLRPGGALVLTVPFICQAHGLPHDYARFTTNGIRGLFEKDYEILEVVALGRAGTTIVNLWLTWLENSMNASRATRLLKGLLLPVWLLVTLLANLIGLGIDALDRTETHYTAVGLLARRR